MAGAQADEAGTRRAVERTVAALCPERVSDGHFRIPGLGGAQRTFGGLLAAQTVTAAACTVPDDRALHSVHGHFLRAGRTGESVDLHVEAVRDGGSFSTRTVQMDQGGAPIFRATLSFASLGDGLSYPEREPPDAPGPEGLEDREEHRARAYHAVYGLEPERYVLATEVRLCDPTVVEPGVARAPYQRNWMRIWPSEVSLNDAMQRALLVYSTDRTMLATARLPLTLGRHQIMNASLDHTVWIHRPPDMRQWHLMECTSPGMHEGRGMILGHVWNQAGEYVATVAQEGLVRELRERRG